VIGNQKSVQLIASLLTNVMTYSFMDSSETSISKFRMDSKIKELADGLTGKAAHSIRLGH